MKLRTYSVLDRIATQYGQLVFFANDATAVRGFIDIVNDKQSDSMMAKHGKDHALCYVGDFDNETGEFTPVLPQIVITGDAAVKPE